MKVVAKRDNDLLIAVSDEWEKEPEAKAYVYEAENNFLMEPFNIHSILARGYWTPFNLSDSELQKIIAKTKKWSPAPSLVR